jgi:hypothetical protein
LELSFFINSRCAPRQRKQLVERATHSHQFRLSSTHFNSFVAFLIASVSGVWGVGAALGSAAVIPDKRDNHITGLAIHHEATR